MGDAPPTSFRLPADILAALRARAEEEETSISDLLRVGALLVLGICPTCQRPTEPAERP